MKPDQLKKEAETPEHRCLARKLVAWLKEHDYPNIICASDGEHDECKADDFNGRIPDVFARKISASYAAIGEAKRCEDIGDSKVTDQLRDLADVAEKNAWKLFLMVPCGCELRWRDWIKEEGLGDWRVVCTENCKGGNIVRDHR
ncbi:hypothetical protein ACFL6Y_07080 [Elusimicrobiota bacterium]